MAGLNSRRLLFDYFTSRLLLKLAINNYQLLFL